VPDSHASVSCNVDLHSDVSGQVSVNLSLLGRVNSWGESSRGDIEALVSDFIDHLLVINIYYNSMELNK
jgi:hypothetical protein